MSASLPIRARRDRKSHSLQKTLCSWFEKNGRDLPWRRTRDPYAIAVSEFMLQQTRVAAVVPFYQRWLERFPDWKSLANAKEQEVLAVWQGLGYYSRARNLHALAVEVCERYNGKLPSDAANLRGLPGIGEYTAAAIRAFAFDLPAPVMDANIARVLARWSNFREPVDNARGRAMLLARAEALQPLDGARVWNSAIMELGALICRAGVPDCLLCPVQNFCRSRGHEPEMLPVKRARPATIRRTDQRVVFFHGGKIWLQQSQGPHWKGFWMLPEPGSRPPARQPDAICDYSITRFLVRMEIFVRSKAPPKRAAPTLQAFAVDQLGEIPMPAPHRRAVAQLLKTVQV